MSKTAVIAAAIATSLGLAACGGDALPTAASGGGHAELLSQPATTNPVASTEETVQVAEVTRLWIQPETLVTVVSSSAEEETATTNAATTSSLRRTTQTRPATSKPATSKPATSKPATSKPATSKPATSKPATSKPATSKPPTTPPGPTANVSVTKRLRVQPETVPCQGFVPQTCMMVSEDGGANYYGIYEGISGFTFVEGTTYVLDVRVETLANPPADASSIRYHLIEIVSQSAG